MKKRSMLLLAAIGTLILLATSFQRIQPTQQLTVYDADGKKVGVVTGGNYTYGQFAPLVPLRVDGVPLMVTVFRDGFLLNNPRLEVEGFGASNFALFSSPLPVLIKLAVVSKTTERYTRQNRLAHGRKQRGHIADLSFA